jgi:hypothetical protein
LLLPLLLLLLLVVVVAGPRPQPVAAAVAVTPLLLAAAAPAGQPARLLLLQQLPLRLQWVQPLLHPAGALQGLPAGVACEA